MKCDVKLLHESLYCTVVSLQVGSQRRSSIPFTVKKWQYSVLRTQYTKHATRLSPSVINLLGAAWRGFHKDTTDAMYVL
jgi:hypothetical protein